VIATLPGLACTIFVKWNKELVQKIMYITSAIFFLCGLMNIFSASLYAADVLVKYQGNLLYFNSCEIKVQNKISNEKFKLKFENV